MQGHNFYDTTLSEHRFWLQIMGDHARFIFFSLSPNEVEYLQRSQDFIIGFDELLDGVNNISDYDELELITEQALKLTYHFREFKLLLLSHTLSSDIKMHLPSTVINDMLNELEEYLKILSSIQLKDSILFHPLQYHLLWLEDAAGHAAAVAAGLDPIEKDLTDKCIYFENQFINLFLKATKMNGYTRTQLSNFASLERLNKQAENTIISFMDFLSDIRDQRINGRILGSLFPLLPDHMFREECYYLWKLSQTAGLAKRPDCNPASPRIEG